MLLPRVAQWTETSIKAFVRAGEYAKRTARMCMWVGAEGSTGASSMQRCPTRAGAAPLPGRLRVGRRGARGRSGTGECAPRSRHSTAGDPDAAAGRLLDVQARDAGWQVVARSLEIQPLPESCSRGGREVTPVMLDRIA